MSAALNAGTAAPRPISDVHLMLDELVRTQDATFLNEVLNEPSVEKWARGEAEGPIDASAVLANPNNVCLMGEHGGIIFVKLGPGLYEAHTQVLPAGRGAWTIRMVRAALHYLFVATDCLEVLTRCPVSNRLARALAKRIDGVEQFRAERGWLVEGKWAPADIFSLTIQDWMRTAPGLVERGEWFHDRLREEYERHGKTEPLHHDELSHNRYVGVACELFMAGNVLKALQAYNRFAVVSGYQQIQLVSASPLTVDIEDAILVVRGGDFYVATFR